MDTTKITVRIHPGLLKKFNDDMDRCFIKRDGFLNQILKTEVKHLEADLKGLKLGPQAHRYIGQCLKRHGAKPVNLLLEKQVVRRLNEVVDSANVVRDAFFNFLLLCLRSTPQFLKHFELPARHTPSDFEQVMDPVAVSPLDAISEAMADPFYYLREAVRDRWGAGFYTLQLPEEMHAFSCYLDEKDVPGTEANRAEALRMAELSALLLEELENRAFAGGQT